MYIFRKISRARKHSIAETFSIYFRHECRTDSFQYKIFRLILIRYLQSITEILQFSNNRLLRSNTSSVCSFRVVLMTRALCAKAFAIALAFFVDELRSEPRLDGVLLERRCCC